MNFGNLSGLINGTEQIVFDYEVTGSAVSSIDTGNILNGDVDGWYTVIIMAIGGTSGVNQNYTAIRFNGDTSTNYGTRGFLASNTSLSNQSGTGDPAIFLGYQAFQQNNISFGVAKVYAKSGAVRLVNSIYASGITGTTVSGIQSHGGVWNNTASNITSMQFYGHTSGTFGIGTRVIILKSNNFTGGMPTGVITTPYINGAWIEIDSNILGASASSVTFSGLSGNTDQIYMISQMIKAKTSSQYSVFRFNGDTSTSNYGLQQIRGQSTSLTAERRSSDGFLYNNIGGTGAGSYYQLNTILFAKSGFQRVTLSNSATGISGTTVDSIGVNGGTWINTANELTTILCYPTAGEFDIGSQFKLYALKPNG